jgi:glycerol-3-phosphate acyltransferase PlsX
MPTIAVDAMGGDFAPEAVVRGVAAVSLTTDIQCVLVGDPRRIQKILESVPYNPEHIDLSEAGDVIGMEEEPKEAVRRKRDASILVAARMVAQGLAAAMVTAGNTGAVILASARHLPIIPGIRRTALASVYPRQVEYPGQDQLALILDVGATIRCDATELVQFALMGNAYARSISKVAAPHIALLNMGREETKGGEVLTEAYRQLRSRRDLNFVGNIEGHELATGRADVIVCEGLLGNVVLKLLEGLAEVATDIASTAAQQNWRWKLGLAMLSSGVGRLRQLTDYASYGGAPLLGFEHVVIKAHGRSTDRAIANAVKVAAKAVREGVPAQIKHAVTGGS